MKLTIEKKNKLLDYAIERINQYDKALRYDNAGIANAFMPLCIGCRIAGREFLGVIIRDCKICPFAIKKNGTRCRPKWQMWKKPKEHQDDLIKAVNKWCEKFYPKYEVVRV